MKKQAKHMQSACVCLRECVRERRSESNVAMSVLHAEFLVDAEWLHVVISMTARTLWGMVGFGTGATR